jgi:hypothetical protein
MINAKGTVKYSIKEIINMKDSLSMHYSKDMANSSIQMVGYTKVSLTLTLWRVLEKWFGLTGSLMKVVLRISY